MNHPSYYKEKVEMNKTVALIKKQQDEAHSRIRVETFLSLLDKKLEELLEWKDVFVLHFNYPQSDEELYSGDVEILGHRLNELGWNLDKESITWHLDDDGPILHKVGIQNICIRVQ